MFKFRVDIQNDNKPVFERVVDAEDGHDAIFQVLQELKNSAQATAPTPWTVSVHKVSDA